MQHKLHKGKESWVETHRDQEIEAWLGKIKHARGPDPEPVVQDV